jgi:hypothetical protein
MFAPPRLSSLGRAIELGDYLRRSPARLGEACGHKEWLHFLIADSGLQLLLNFNVADARDDEQAHLIALACDREGWTGGLSSPPWSDVDLVGGTIDVRIGGSRAVWREGVFAIAIDEPELGITALIRLHPITHPSIVHNFPLGADHRMHWFALPRLWASGTVVARGRVHELRGAPAYHDHNWGSFAWGGDYSWQWGFGLPQSLGDPWSVVFLVVHDRHGHAADVRGVFVWRHAREQRLFRDREVQVRSEGVWYPERVHTVPGVMRLLRPGTATVVPERLVIEACGRGDELRCTFRPRAVARIVVPNDGDSGLTVLNEVSGALAVEGRVGGEDVGYQTETIVEFLGD